MKEQNTFVSYPTDIKLICVKGSTVPFIDILKSFPHSHARVLCLTFYMKLSPKIMSAYIMLTPYNSNKIDLVCL